jgi:thymidylate synthase (FAD)
MKVIKQSWVFEEEVETDKILKKLEMAGRTCWKSEDKCTLTSAPTFVKGILTKNHESVIEHHSISVRIITNRAITHEIVRHRLASYSQESTRYANYSRDKFGNEITVILPLWFYDVADKSFVDVSGSPELTAKLEQYNIWLESIESSQKAYLQLLGMGQMAQEARGVLPNDLKTEIVVTMNLRSWRHFFRLRTDKAAHPQIRELASSMLIEFKAKLPVIFEGI